MSDPDRVSWTMGIKLNTGEYENVSLNVSLSTDVKIDENAVQAVRRCQNFCEKRIRVKEKEIRKAYRKFTDFDTMAKMKAGRKE